MIVKFQSKGITKKIPFKPELKDLEKVKALAARFVSTTPEFCSMSFVDAENERIVIEDELDLEYFYESLKTNKNMGIEVEKISENAPVAEGTFVESSCLEETLKHSEETVPQERNEVDKLETAVETLKAAIENVKESFAKNQTTQVECFALPETKTEFIDEPAEEVVIINVPAEKVMIINVPVEEFKEETNEEIKEEIEEKIEQKVEEKVEEKIEEKVEKKIEEKVQEKVEEKIQEKIEEKVKPVPKKPEVHQFIHRSITCDGCRKHPLVGVRYKCMVCDDYDLCKDCESNGHPHPMLRIPETQESYLYLTLRRQFLEKTAFYKEVPKKDMALEQIFKFFKKL